MFKEDDHLMRVKLRIKLFLGSVNHSCIHVGPSTAAEDESHVQKAPSRCRASGHCRRENPLQLSGDEVIE